MQRKGNKFISDLSKLINFFKIKPKYYAKINFI